MIVLATEEFAVGLRLAGVKNSHIINTKEQAEKILKTTDVKELIISTQKVVELAPVLNEYPNLVVFPDTVYDFSNIGDLKIMAKKVVGAEVDI